MYKLILSFLFCLFLQNHCQHLEIKNLNQDPILLLHLKHCYIQTGIIKIVHPINLTILEENANTFLEISRRIDRTSPISDLIIRKSKQIADSLIQLKPIKSRRQKRWDSIGTAWKWIAGSPDAEDLRLINSSLNDLIDQSNEQLKANHVINERITAITNNINQLIDHHTSLNTILLKEMDAITLLLSLDATNNILEEIEDTILRSRVSLPSSKLLTLKEIFLIESILNEQGITTDFPEDALNYVKPKVASRNDTLLYILEIPKTHGDCQIIKVIPLIVNDTVITDAPSYIIKSNKKLFTTNEPQKTVQQLHETQPFSDHCVFPIVMGLESHCYVTQSNQTTIQSLPGSKLLIVNVKNQFISSNCGPHNRILTGNFLLNFEKCSIQIENETFVSEEIISNTKQLIGIFPGLSLNKYIINKQNFSTLTWQTMNNRHRIEHIVLQQFEHKRWFYGILGSFSFTTFIIITIAIICFRRKKVVFTVRYPRSNKKSKQKKLGKSQQLAEDVQSYPPEELRDGASHVTSTPAQNA
ncbi:uncharacterized protein LOC129782449 [Toxorhynchites rutilus septentrionalis]|uniref:uncharacterized protein LOC129782449 n=1 Tax=Toxorhynchites rutilus septentrionalis TaxID=329112 RepID=UPI002478B85F|nr:uncharacterized protein LOC129782449 [Toxorhynchites rutilus septentrionalis]